jgi:[methyl-Co(III) methanol-specific corrinoid protein]:coenzyme M methyltransferase
MTSCERFMMALLRSGRVDRPAAGNPTSVATVESMELSGAFFPEAHTDPEKMAKLAMVGHDELGFDTVAPYFSVQQEAAAFGCDVNWGTEDSMPDIRENPYNDPEEIPDSKDLLDHPALRTVVEAIRILKKHYGNEAAVIGKVMGPWTLSYHLYGVQRFLMDTILDPEKVKRFLEVLKNFPVRFAAAQFEAGADAVTLADHATGDLVGPDTYRDFLFPVHREITGKLSRPLILHICGRTTDRLPYIVKAGFAAFHFDSKNDLEEAVRIGREGKITMVGNINNPEVLYKGTSGDVRNAVFKALKAGVDIIGPECAIPLRTPNENLKALVRGVHEFEAIL